MGYEYRIFIGPNNRRRNNPCTFEGLPYFFSHQSFQIFPVKSKYHNRGCQSDLKFIERKLNAHHLFVLECQSS